MVYLSEVLYCLFFLKYHTNQLYVVYFSLTGLIHMIFTVKTSLNMSTHVGLCFSTIWHINALAHVTVFHCPRHRVSYYFPHSFCTLAFYKSVSAQSDSPPAWRLTFPVKEPYCWFLIPFHPPLHKTMVSIASTEYIHSSEWETGWPGPYASLPGVLPDSQADLFIPSDSFLLRHLS